MPLFGQTKREVRKIEKDELVRPSSGYRDDRLLPEHLYGETELEIASTEIASFWSKSVGAIGKTAQAHPVPSIVVRFKDVTLPLVCTPVQLKDLTRICGSEDWHQWPGHTVTLLPKVYDSRNNYIEVQPAPPAQR